MTNINNPFGPKNFINKVPINGPDVAPTPNKNCKPDPAETILSFSIKSLVCESAKEKIGRQRKEKIAINK